MLSFSLRHKDLLADQHLPKFEKARCALLLWNLACTDQTLSVLASFSLQRTLIGISRYRERRKPLISLVAYQAGLLSSASLSEP